MKNKLSKIMGIGFAIVLIASLLLFAVPAAAGPFNPLHPALPNMWWGFPDTPSAPGSWFFDPAITQVGPMDKAINDDIYTYVAGTAATPFNAGTNDVFKSTDGGRTWTVSTIPNYLVNTAATPAAISPVVDIVCSAQSEDVVYLTDGNYVYKSINGGLTFTIVAEDSLETLLVGTCGPAVVLTGGGYITCLDVGYNAAGDSIVFIGTTSLYTTGVPPTTDTAYPTVLYINEAGYPAAWADLGLHCFRAPDAVTPGMYIPYALAAAPDFSISKKLYVTVTNSTDGNDGLPHTFVISSVGVFCSWAVVDELFWDCNPANNFDIMHASRMVFTSEYATFGNIYVGVVGYDHDAGGADDAFGGDVYVAYDTMIPAADALDLNVQGYTSACIGIWHANICSLDVSENDELAAGAWDSFQFQTPTRVYYSADGGWTWSPSLKDPTGRDRCYVLFGNSIFAGTRFCNCGFSLDCGPNPGQFFNQISLVNMAIDEVLDLTHSPGYSVNSSTMYVLINNTDACQQSGTQNTHDLLRWDGTYWERVHSSRFFDAITQTWIMLPLYDWVEVSPDFNNTGCLYMANTAFYMTRSTDQGCSWRPLAYPCAPRPTISAWIVVDEETVLAAGASANSGWTYKTTRHGTRPWTPSMVLDSPTGIMSVHQGVDFDLSPSIATDGSVLFGNDYGEVFLSTDVGSTWAELTDVPPTFFDFGGIANTYVVFDPGYGTAGDPGETMVYAAAGSLVGRQAVGSGDWVYISSAAAACDPFAMINATGIDAHGDTALYVSDSGSPPSGTYVLQASGTIGVRYTCDVPSAGSLCTCDLEVPLTNISMITGTGTFQNGEPLNVITYDLECQWDGDVEGILTFQGLVSGAMGTITINLDSEMDECFLCTVDGGAVEFLFGNLTVYSTGVTAAEPTGVWRCLNPMDLMPPVWPVPLVEWEFLYTYSACSFIHPEADGLGVFPDDLWLTETANSNVLWCLEDCPEASPTDYIWIWDDPLARPVIQVQPADGALLPTTTTATLEWQPLDAATMYEVMVFSWCDACPANMAEFLDFETALTCEVITGLTPGTIYFWKVRVACDSPFVSKWSDLRSFKTALGAVPYLCAPWCGQNDVILTSNFAWDAVVGATGYEVQVATDEAFANIVASGSPTSNAWAPADPLEYSTVYYWRVRALKDGIYSAWAVCIFTTMDAPVDPPAPPPAVVVEQTEITPVWIWVIIGIGGALTICVVILIVTTRKVP